MQGQDLKANVIVLAAGRGTRMLSQTPKLLHEVCGKSLIDWVLDSATALNPAKLVVVAPADGSLDEGLPSNVTKVVQKVDLHGDGTAGAAAAAIDAIDQGSPVLVVTGDAPLVSSEVLGEMLAAHQQAANSATVLSAVLDDPGQLGRVVRDADGSFLKIVETKAAGDATAQELEIREVNAGVYIFDSAKLAQSLPQVGSENAQGERYLPDVLGILKAAGDPVGVHAAAEPEVVLGVNDRADLAVVTQIAQQRIIRKHQLAGVTVLNPASTVIEPDVQIGKDTVIEPGCVLRGTTTIGSGSVIGPHSVVIDSNIGDGVSAIQSHINQASVGDEASVGPFAYLRPGAKLLKGSKAGTFVEIKNSEIGEGTKVPHLSYIGDAQIGAGSNIGAATITANYDGHHKHRTTVGSDVRTGVDTTLVAPVTLGDGSYTGAGSIITKDIPAGALGIAREKQRNLAGYAEQAAAKAGQRVKDEG